MYGECPRIPYTKVSAKMAYVYIVYHFYCILRNRCINSKFEVPKVWNEVFEIYYNQQNSLHACVYPQ